MPLSQDLIDLFDALMYSSTVKPFYKIPHIIKTFHIIAANIDENQGVGRYKIGKELDLGAGTVKTLITRLKENEIITSIGPKQKGHVFTDKGWRIYESLVEYIPPPIELKNPRNKYVLGIYAFMIPIAGIFVKKQRSIGIVQRDAARDVGGEGASCLLFDGTNFIFPDTPLSDYKIPMTELLSDIMVRNNAQKKDNPKGVNGKDSINRLESGDYIIIGGGKTKTSASLAAIAAALSLLLS